MCAPIAARGQQAKPRARTHVVRPGETLWRIATIYLGDGHRWREIVALNAGVAGEARALRAGTRLRLPLA